MKPTAEQEKLITQILRSILKYKNTYDEMYDHILTSLEFVDADISFVDALHHIIETELGGAKGIKLIEAKNVKLAIREFIKDYFMCALKCLTSPSLLVISISTVLFYMLIKQPWFSENITKTAIAWGLPVGPVLMHILNKMAELKKSGVKLIPLMGQPRSEIQGYFSMFLGFLPYFLWVIPDLIYGEFHYAKLPDTASLILLFMTALHMLACYELYTAPKSFEYRT